MIRTVVTADKNTLILALPDSYIGRQLEIIAFAIDEPVRQTQRASAKNVFKALKFDTRGFKFNRDEANSR
ncbi:MAG: hypothetical protein EHM93_10235 [Bacteroidales bacterium]|nr:MAG: hypothetical protein EHM93_10235 [Bacteroidales bacterium]